MARVNADYGCKRESAGVVDNIINAMSAMNLSQLKAMAEYPLPRDLRRKIEKRIRTIEMSLKLKK